MRVPGGGASCLGVGRPGSGALPPLTARPLGGLPVPTTHWLWVWGGASVGTRHQPHSARSCVLALRAVGAARGCPGGAPLAWVWGVRGRALSHPRLPALWAGCRGPLPTGCGCGGVREWRPVTNPTARLLCALWGRHEGARGGRLLPGCGASGVGRSPTTDCPHSGLAAGAHYPLAVGAGGCGCGDPSPTPRRALLRAGCARCGGGTRAPGGGASCLGVGRPGSGALPPPTARPLGGLPGPTTHWLWVRGGAGVGTRHQPHVACSCELAVRAAGAARERPRGAPPAWVWDVRGRALSHPRLPALWAGCRGPIPTGCGCGGVRAWGPITNPTARALASWLCALLGRHEGARGGRLLPGCGASGVGRSPTPDCPPSGRAAGAHYPLAVGAGGCGRGDPSPTPRRALLRAGCARCGGSKRAPAGGASCLGVGRPGSGALPPPTARPLGGLPGPTTHWLWVRRGAGVGTHHQPHSARSCELALRAVGAARGCPGGAPPARVWGVRGRALSQLRLPALWAGAGAHYSLAVGVGKCGRGDPSPTPQRAGFARCRGGMRVPGGGASCLGVGRPGSGALPPLTARPLGGLPRSTTHWLWVWGGAGVGTRHQPHSALALRAVGAACECPGGAPLAWVWGVRGRALSHPGLPALWAGCRGPLPTGCGCGGPRAWGPVTNPTARWLCARWGRHEGARGGRLLPGCGASGVGRSPDRHRPPSVRAAGAHYPLAVVAGGAGVGTRHQPHSARSCELALRAVGAARGRPGGAPPAWVWGVRGRALSQPRLPALWVGCRGPLPTGCGCGGPRAWGPVPNPTARWLCALWGQHESARGGCLLPGCGASGVGRSAIPDCPPSGRAAGAHYPLAVGPGGCGRGDPSPTPQRALLRAGFARCRGGTRAPGGGASCLGVGRPGSGALPPPTARPLGGLPGPTTHWLLVWGGAGVGTRHQPHSTLALRAVGAARGCPGGAPLAWVWGVRGRALSDP